MASILTLLLAHSSLFVTLSNPIVIFLPQIKHPKIVPASHSK
jgi:hypothetical protein